MFEVQSLPAVNAILNSASTVLLLTAYYQIRRGNRLSHHRLMIAAVIVSALFLISYLIYHSQAGSTPFRGQGWIRPVYFTILISHIVLAGAIVPLVLITLVRALRERFQKHRKIARWTLPVWLYVSVTGVIIYLLLYHLYPPV